MNKSMLLFLFVGFASQGLSAPENPVIPNSNPSGVPRIENPSPYR